MSYRLRARIRSTAVGIWAVLALLFLFLPIFVTAVFSFNDPKGRFNFTWQGFTLKYWTDPFGVPGLQDSVALSLQVAVISTIIALILGTAISMALVRYRFRGRTGTELFTFMPLATPEVVLGASLLSLFLTMGFETGFVTIIIAHTMFNISYVVVTMRARLEGMDMHIEEAAADLGANEFTAFRKVTLPMIAPGLAAAGLLSFVLSFDDFVITNFTAGTEVTFPLFIYGAARQGIPPQVNVIATGLLVIVLLLMGLYLLYERGRARKRKQAALRTEQ